MRFVIIATIITFLYTPVSAASITWVYNGNPFVDAASGETTNGYKMSLTVPRDLVGVGKSFSVGGSFETFTTPAEVFSGGTKISSFSDIGISYSGICNPFQTVRSGNFSISISDFTVTSGCFVDFEFQYIQHRSGATEAVQNMIFATYQTAAPANWEAITPVPLPATGVLLSLGLFAFASIGRIFRRS